MTGSISPLSVICVRNEPDERAALETQVLFGEVFWVEEQVKGWCKVRLDFDGYSGWVSEKAIHHASDLEIDLWKKRQGMIVHLPMVKLVREPDKSTLVISAGSQLVFNGNDLNSISVGQREFYLQGRLPDRKPDLEEVAKGFLNVPYLWGGRSFFGIDCSGFVQVVFKVAGIQLPRNASSQVLHGNTISFVEDARPGDLAFFDNENGDITHVGICLGNGRVIHASSEVRLDYIDHQGIFNHERKKYTHQLRLIKRVL